jgi:glutaredoxin 3
MNRRFYMKFFLIIACMLSSLCFGGEAKGHSSEKKPTLTLYYSPRCPYCIKVLNHLEKMHKSVPLANVQDAAKKKELMKIGGKGQVPCLVINGKAMYESQAIMKWFSNHPDYLNPTQ